MNFFKLLLLGAGFSQALGQSFRGANETALTNINGPSKSPQPFDLDNSNVIAGPNNTQTLSISPEVVPNQPDKSEQQESVAELEQEVTKILTEAQTPETAIEGIIGTLKQGILDQETVKTVKEQVEKTYDTYKEQGASEAAYDATKIIASDIAALAVAAAIDKGKEKIVESKLSRAVHNSLGLKTNEQEKEETEAKINSLETKNQTLEPQVQKLKNDVKTLDDNAKKTSQEQNDKINELQKENAELKTAFQTQTQNL